jgi:MYXO-CTERM domain-containing protein
VPGETATAGPLVALVAVVIGVLGLRRRDLVG